MMYIVERVWRRGDHFPGSGMVWEKGQGILVFYQLKKREYESLHSILVTRNPNWS